jgi:hypothetical protein
MNESKSCGTLRISTTRGMVVVVHALLLHIILVTHPCHITWAFRSINPNQNMNIIHNNPYQTKNKLDWILYVGKMTSKTAGTTTGNRKSKQPSSNKNKIQNLLDWCNDVNIRISPSFLSIQNDGTSGLGWYCTKEIPKGSVVLSVPSKIAISVECPGDGPNRRSVMDRYNLKHKVLASLPWYAQLSLYLNTLKVKPQQQQQQQNDDEINYQPWIDTLPSSFDTPYYWSAERLEQLQYEPMVRSVKKQKENWKKIYDTLNIASILSYTDFVWGCECARSRSFSRTSTGAPFNPSIYAFVLLLMTIYVGFNIGTIEQAANGGGLVISFSILKGKL